MTSVLYIQEQYIITPRKSNILLFLKGTRVSALKLKSRSDCKNRDVDLQLVRSSYLWRYSAYVQTHPAATYRCLLAWVRGCPLYSESDLSGFLWQGCVLWLPTQRAGVPRKRPSTAWPLTVPTRPVADTPWMSPRKGTLSERKKLRGHGNSIHQSFWTAFQCTDTVRPFTRWSMSALFVRFNFVFKTNI